MPTISNGIETEEVEPNTDLIDAAEKIGIPFSCTQGSCGTCLTTVVSGMENLTPPSQAELDFGLEPNERLLCQAKIISGDVVFES